MATETQKLKNDQKVSEEISEKTLAPSDPVIKSSSAANRLEVSSDATNQPSQQPSATEDYGEEGLKKEDGESEGGDASSAGVTPASSEENNASVTDIQKKMRRAERFGVAVQLSEVEKRNSRAERFGTVPSPSPTSEGKDSLKSAEELKRKARAERFGLPAKSTADEETKKKARLSKFAPVSKPDSVEEDKRKARAARFSQSSPSSLSHVNGEGNIEPKAAIAGKAGGGD